MPFEWGWYQNHHSHLVQRNWGILIHQGCHERSTLWKPWKRKQWMIQYMFQKCVLKWKPSFWVSSTVFCTNISTTFYGDNRIRKFIALVLLLLTAQWGLRYWVWNTIQNPTNYWCVASSSPHPRSFSSNFPLEGEQTILLVNIYVVNGYEHTISVLITIYLLCP